MIIMDAKEISALVLERERLRQNYMLLIARILQLDDLYKNARKPDNKRKHYDALVATQKERDAILERQSKIDIVLVSLGFVKTSPIRKLEDPKPKQELTRGQKGKRPMSRETKAWLQSLRKPR